MSGAVESTQEESAMRSLVTHAAWQILAPPRLRRRFYQRPPPPVQAYAREQVMGMIPWLLQMLKFLLLGSLLLLTSAASYALVFYPAVMPARHATVPLHFDYSSVPTESGLIVAPRNMFRRKQTESPVVPAALVDLFAKHVAWEALVETVAPPPIAKKRLLHARQAYYIELLLSLPESIHNRQAGLFGVVTELQAINATFDARCKYHQLGAFDAMHTITIRECLETQGASTIKLARSTRWTQLPHESAWITLSRKLACLPAFWVGALTEFRTIEVAAFRHYVESREFPLRYVTVQLQRHSAHQPVVEVLHGELRIGKELNMFQELLKEWYYTGFFVGTLTFAVIYLLMWSFLLQLLARMGLEDPICDLDMDMSLGGDYDGTYERHTRASREPPMQEGGAEEDVEPRFEDWQDSEEVPITTTRAAPVPEPAPSSRCPHHFERQDDSEGEWEDIFYPAADS